nr:unnamed protein product [Digitaria exilis]
MTSSPPCSSGRPFLPELQHDPAVACRDGAGVLEHAAVVVARAQHGIGQRCPRRGPQADEPSSGRRRDEAWLRGGGGGPPPARGGAGVVLVEEAEGEARQLRQGSGEHGAVLGDEAGPAPARGGGADHVGAAREPGEDGREGVVRDGEGLAVVADKQATAVIIQPASAVVGRGAPAASGQISWGSRGCRG